MRTAAAYTNKVKVQTVAKNTKVDYPGNVAKNVQPLAPACAVNPAFGVLTYSNVRHYCALTTHGCTK
jgi:hypothetical protein